MKIECKGMRHTKPLSFVAHVVDAAMHVVGIPYVFESARILADENLNNVPVPLKEREREQIECDRTGRFRKFCIFNLTAANS